MGGSPVTQLSEEDRDALNRIAAAQEADTIDRALAAARERLHMDSAYVSHIDSRRQKIDDTSGDPSALGFGSGTEVPIEDTYCRRMLRGELPNVVPDTSREPAVRGLDATTRVGSYVGVAITLADGTVHGTLCCASREPREQLGEEELAFMRILADMVAARIDRLVGNQPR
jgi:GAF domain-containing protein